MSNKSIRTAWISAALALMGLTLFVYFGDFFVKNIRVQYADLIWLVALGYLFIETGAISFRTTLNAIPRAVIFGISLWLLVLSFILFTHLTLANLTKYVGYLALALTFVLCYLVVNLTDHQRWLRNIIGYLLALHFATNLLGGILGLSGIDGWGSQDFQGAFYFELVRTVGLTDHPDRSALVYIVLYGLWLLCISTAREPVPKSGQILIWATPVVALWTVSPIAMLVFSLLGVHVWDTIISSKKLLGLALITGGILVSLLLAYVAPLRSDQGEWRIQPAPRTIIQQSVENTVVTSPWLGHGLTHRGATVFSTGYPPRVIRRPTDPHNAYLDLLSTGGVVLLLGYLVFIGSLLCHRSNHGVWPLVLVIWLIVGLMHSTNDERIMYFGLGIAAALAGKRQMQTECVSQLLKPNR